uniref:Uncharacterized protein n=1 Tax=viral metagenome TaxID=1070528 RepID=A0A6C0KN65_9ZZZZ
MNQNSEIFDNNEFVFTQTKNEDGNNQMIGGGYKIKSFFLNDGIPIMTTINDSNQTGEDSKVSNIFENLAIPAGLFYINQKIPKNEFISENNILNHNMLPDEILDKLFGLVEVDKKRKRKTRKQIIGNNKKNTRKHF